MRTTRTEASVPVDAYLWTHGIEVTCGFLQLLCASLEKGVHLLQFQSVSLGVRSLGEIVKKSMSP